MEHMYLVTPGLGRQGRSFNLEAVMFQLLIRREILEVPFGFDGH